MASGLVRVIANSSGNDVTVVVHARRQESTVDVTGMSSSGRGLFYFFRTTGAKGG